MFQQGVDNGRHKKGIMNLFHNQLHNERRTVKGMVEDELSPALEPFDIHRSNGCHVHKGTRRNKIVPGFGRCDLVTQCRQIQPVVVAQRAALRLGLGS
jgi:hypothetical protein